MLISCAIIIFFTSMGLLVIVRIVGIDVEWVHILLGNRRHFNDLTAKPPYYWMVLSLRVRHDYIVIGHKENIDYLALCGKRLTGARRTKEKTVRVSVKRNFFDWENLGKSEILFFTLMPTCVITIERTS